MNNPKFGFELRIVRLPLTSILPVRYIKEPEKAIRRYKAVRDSIKVVGLIEPLVVYPQKGNSGTYFLNDGHLRLCALKELHKESADCIVATEDECFTYNARISRISPIQEHKMIVKAVRNGVKLEKIAEALNLPVRHIIESMNLLKGIDEKAADMIKEKNIPPSTIRLLKKVNAERQIEMVELMLSINNFTPAYAEVLILATPKNHLKNPDKPKTKQGISSEDIAQMEQEMETLQHDAKTVERDYGADVLTLTLARGYIKKLLENAKIVRFLNLNYREILTEFEGIAATESL
jgi:ParB-like chromosome segregation protein Spo0J